MDLLLGHFADAFLEAMSDAEVDLFEEILNCSDQSLYAWYCGREPVPHEQKNEIMDRFLAFDVSPYVQGNK